MSLVVGGDSKTTQFKELRHGLPEIVVSDWGGELLERMRERDFTQSLTQHIFRLLHPGDLLT